MSQHSSRLLMQMSVFTSERNVNGDTAVEDIDEYRLFL